jgi:outer membrane protein assembly factor BamE (lipoprotein component of BamABCDE complex)
MVMRTVILCVVLAAAAATSGCLIVPIPRSVEEEGIRATIGREELAFVHTGETTRREVLLTLGEPDDTQQQGQYYSCYVVGASRTDVHWGVFIPAPGGGGAGASGVLRSGSRDFLLLRFDAAGVVQKVKVETVRYGLNNYNIEVPFKTSAQLIREWAETEPD